MRKIALWLPVLLALAYFSTAVAAPPQTEGQQGAGSQDVRFAPAEDLTGSVVLGRDGQKLARVDGVVLDLHLGTVAYVALRSGGIGDFGTSRIAVPWDRFNVASSDRLTLNADRATLARAPRFAENEWGRIGTDVEWGRGVSGYWGSSGLAGLSGAQPGGGLDLVRADEMKGWRVIGKGGEDIADVRRVILNLSNGTVATILVAAAGPVDATDRRIAVPYQKFAPTRDRALVLNADPKTLAQAPSVQEKGWGIAGTDPAWNRTVYAYWGAKFPSEAGMASAAGQPAEAQPTPMGQRSGQ
jgi:sporulation protein YlmC with PRC-barrel domain